MKNNKTLICFLGSRGSGKTTIANLLDEYLHRKRISCARQHPGFKRYPVFPSLMTAIYLWKFFDFKIMKYFGFVGRTKKGRPSLYRIYLPLALNHDLKKLSKSNTDCLIYDSNILRGIISAYFSKTITKEEILDLYQKKVLSKISRIIFVVVETDPEEAVNRWIERDNVQLSEIDKFKEIENRKQLDKNINTVIDVLSELGGTEVINLDGSIDPEINAQKIIQSI